MVPMMVSVLIEKERGTHILEWRCKHPPKPVCGLVLTQRRLVVRQEAIADAEVTCRECSRKLEILREFWLERLKERGLNDD